MCPAGPTPKAPVSFNSSRSSNRGVPTVVPFSLPKKEVIAASVGVGSKTRAPGTVAMCVEKAAR